MRDPATITRYSQVMLRTGLLQRRLASLGDTPKSCQSSPAIPCQSSLHLDSPAAFGSVDNGVFRGGHRRYRRATNHLCANNAHDFAQSTSPNAVVMRVVHVKCRAIRTGARFSQTGWAAGTYPQSRDVHRSLHSRATLRSRASASGGVWLGDRRCPGRRARLNSGPLAGCRRQVLDHVDRGCSPLAR